LPAKLQARPERPTVNSFQATGLDGQISPLLEKQIIVGGDSPLRLALDEHGAGTVSAFGHVSEQSLKRQLEPVLPFAAFELKPRTGFDRSPPGDRAEQTTRLFLPPVKLGGNVLSADSSSLMPALGPPGAALLGWTLANRLGRIGAKKK
jgi:hypothetical protein